MPKNDEISELMAATRKYDIVSEDRPAFEFSYHGHHFKIWADGRVNIDPQANGFVRINRIPHQISAARQEGYQQGYDDRAPTTDERQKLDSR